MIAAITISDSSVERRARAIGDAMAMVRGAWERGRPASASARGGGGRRGDGRGGGRDGGRGRGRRGGRGGRLELIVDELGRGVGGIEDGAFLDPRDGRGVELVLLHDRQVLHRRIEPQEAV